MFKKEILKNGLRLLTIPMRDTKTVTVLVLVGTGSKYETKALSGVSHFLEHMTFKGTKKRPTALAFSEELDKVGAEYNAFTQDEVTGYYVKTDASHLDLALDMLSDMLLHSKFRAEDIEKEKGVVVEEMRMYRDDPMRHVGDMLDEVMYGDQPAGWNIAGTESSVRALTSEGIVGYVDAHYRAGNTVVCVAGSFDKRAITKKVTQFFGGMKEGIGQQKQPVVEKQNAPARLIETRKTDQTHMYLAFRSDINAYDERRFAQALLGNIMGGNMSSRLFINVREKHGLAYYISAGSSTSTDTGYFWVRAGVDTSRATQAMEAILKELRRVREDGVTSAELKKAKEYMRGKTFLELESSDEIAGFFAAQESMGKRVMTPDGILSKISAVTLKEVNKQARALFIPARTNFACVGPFKDHSVFDAYLSKL